MCVLQIKFRVFLNSFVSIFYLEDWSISDQILELYPNYVRHIEFCYCMLCCPLQTALADSHASSICPSGKSNMHMKMSVEHCWNDTDKGNRITVALPLYQPQINHSVTWYRSQASELRSWRLNTWANAQPNTTRTNVNFIYISSPYRAVNTPSRL